MGSTERQYVRCLVLVAFTALLLLDSRTRGQELAPPARSSPTPNAPADSTNLYGDERALPINLATALQLADVRAVDVAAAAERVRVAAAVLEQAQVLWLPTVTVGGDYSRHDGRNQDTQGNVFDNSRSSMMIGAGTGIGPAAVLNVCDAIFAPLVARQRPSSWTKRASRS